MKKRILSLTLVFILLLAILPVNTIKASANTGQEFEPLWLSDYRFINYQAEGGAVRTNGALDRAMQQFQAEYEDRVQNTYRPINSWGGERYRIDVELSDIFRDILIRAWREERFSAMMPFNDAFFDEIFINTEFYFAKGGGGQFISSPVRSQISSSIECDNFVGVIVHEVAHAFGFGETLANLFTCQLRGGSCGDHMDWGDFVYDCYFDWTFMDMMQKQGKGDEFWAAALHSNAEYGRFWDEHMSEYISFRDINLMRGFSDGILGLANLNARIPGLAESFRRTAGISHEAAQDEVKRIWSILLDDQASLTDKSLAKEELQSWVDIFARLSVMHNFGSFQHVFWDYKIRDQHLRFDPDKIIEAPNLLSAADWARNEITGAFNKGFIPTDILNDYSNVITRQEFCRMAVKWVEYRTGKSIDTVLAERNVSRNPNAFSDTKDPYILAAFALGITNGTTAPTTETPGVFTPDGQFSRQEAAAMITRVCGVVGMDTGNPPASDFVDLHTAQSWARDSINFVRAKGIMGGTSQTTSTFTPAGTYTRQESIATFDRIG